MSKKAELAIGLKRVPGGWVVTEYKILNGKILSVKLSEPDNRSIALEKLQRMMTIFWETE